MAKRRTRADGLFVVMKLMRIIIFFSCSGLRSSQDEEIRSLSFDSPYPSSSYKKVLDASMGVFGYLQMLQEEAPLDVELAIIYDALAGRIARTCIYAQNLVNECAHGLPLLTDDVGYLIDIFNCIEGAYRLMAPSHQSAGFDMQSIHQVRDELMGLMPSF